MPFSLLPTFEEGDAVIVIHEGHELFGEVTSINDAENLAEVLLIPSNQTMTVMQDKLSRIQPDSLRRLTPSVVVDLGHGREGFGVCLQSRRTGHGKRGLAEF